MELQTVRTEPGGLRAHYYRAGSGEPVLYLHHLAGLQSGEPALARLAASLDVIAPYHPGWGPAKDDLTAVESPLDFALFYADFLDVLGLERVHVVGISIGAWLGAELAAIFPRRVRKLVLVNPLGQWLAEAPGEDPFAQHPARPTAMLFADPDSRQSLLMEGQDPTEAYVQEVLNLRAGAKFLFPIPDTGIARRLGRIQAATLVVTSEEDKVVLPPYGPLWQSQIAGAHLATLPHAGHLAELEAPEAFAALVSNFILHDQAGQ